MGGGVGLGVTVDNRKMGELTICWVGDKEMAKRADWSWEEAH